MKQVSTHAATAQAIRNELKKLFPSTKFTVRSNSFAGGDSVSIKWENGPTDDNVERVVGKYQYGHFDGMQDLYEHSNRRKDIPQVKFVQTRRDISEDTMEKVFKELQKTHAHFDLVTTIDESSIELLRHWSHWTAREYISRILSKIDLTKGYKAI